MVRESADLGIRLICGHRQPGRDWQVVCRIRLVPWLGDAIGIIMPLQDGDVSVPIRQDDGIVAGCDGEDVLHDDVVYVVLSRVVGCAAPG